MANRYNDAHRLFVQGMLTKRIVTEAEATQLYNHVHSITTRKSLLLIAMDLSYFLTQLFF